MYQAYSPALADAALAAGRFVAPFSFTRMTWIKPSFLWMMYRCGWATKPGQERVLAVEITLGGEAVARYVDEWVAAITDVTATARAMRDLIRAGDEAAAAALLPAEHPYPLPEAIAANLGAVPTSMP
jgi:hypothetical protein